jgi:hypothetical protein
VTCVYVLQVAEWILSYTDASVSLRDIWDSSEDAGDGHSPRGFYGLSAITDESQMRAIGHVQVSHVLPVDHVTDNMRMACARA